MGIYFLRVLDGIFGHVVKKLMQTGKTLAQIGALWIWKQSGNEDYTCDQRYQ